MINKDSFFKLYNQEYPKLLEDFFQQQTPLSYAFANKQRSFIIEIQYFLTLESVTEVHVKNGLFPFCVNSDGFTLFIDLKEKSLPLLQEEYGDLDSLDLSLEDFTKNNKLYSLKKIFNNKKLWVDNGIIYLPKNQNWDLKTKALIIDFNTLGINDVDDEDEPLVATSHNFIDTLESADIEDIISYAKETMKDPSDEFLLKSFLYYYENDAFL